MAGIVINGPSNGTQIKSVQLWTIKYVDNRQYCFKGPHKVLLEIRHGNKPVIINTKRNSISVKPRFARLNSGVGCTSHVSDVR